MGVRVKGKKISKSTTSPLKYAQIENGGSVFRGEEISTQSRENQDKNISEDYTKFTVQKLKHKLTEHGFGADLLQLKTPSKKGILALYEKHVLKR